MTDDPRRTIKTLSGVEDYIKVEPRGFRTLVCRVQSLVGTLLPELSTEGKVWSQGFVFPIGLTSQLLSVSAAGTYLAPALDTFFRLRLSSGSSASVSIILRDQPLSEFNFVGALGSGAVTRGQLLKAMDAYQDGSVAVLEAAVNTLAFDSPIRLSYYHEPFVNRTGNLAEYLPTALGWSSSTIDTVFASAAVQSN